MSRVRTTLVTQWFPPEPTWQPLWIAQALRNSGLDVEVLTGVPNYPTGQVMVGYSALQQRVDDIEGFMVRRTPLYPSHDSRSLGRILNYVSWAVSAVLFGARHLRTRDVSLVYASPATAALPAMVASRIYKVPYVLLVQDVWPDSIFSSGFLSGSVRRPLEWLLHRFVNHTYRKAAHVIAISPGMADLLVSRGVPEGQVSVVYNWVDEGAKSPAQPVQWRERLGFAPESFVLMYAGNHGAAQSLSSAVEAMGLVPEDEDCHLMLVGDGVEKATLQQLASEIAPGRVHFVEPQPREAIAGLMAAADAQLVALADRPLFAVTIPSKLQSIMAAGHPVLAAAAGDVSHVVSHSGCGVAAGAQDPASIANAIRTLRHSSRGQRQAMGNRGRDYYRRTMSEKVGSARLAGILTNVAEGKNR